MALIPQDDDREIDEDIAVIEAVGRTNEGIGRAIEGLAKLGLKAEAAELATQLKFSAKSLGWAMKHVSDRRFPSINAK